MNDNDGQRENVTRGAKQESTSNRNVLNDLPPVQHFQAKYTISSFLKLSKRPAKQHRQTILRPHLAPHNYGITPPFFSVYFEANPHFFLTFLFFSLFFFFLSCPATADVMEKTGKAE